LGSNAQSGRWPQGMEGVSIRAGLPPLRAAECAAGEDEAGQHAPWIRTLL
jgi:hypothetical protein